MRKVLQSKLDNFLVDTFPSDCYFSWFVLLRLPKELSCCAAELWRNIGIQDR